MNHKEKLIRNTMVIMVVFLFSILLSLNFKSFAYAYLGPKANTQDTYPWLMQKAGKTTDSVQKWSTFNSTDFYKFYQNKGSKINTYFRRSDNINKWGNYVYDSNYIVNSTDYQAAIDNNYRLVCSYHGAGDLSNYSPIKLKAMVLVNPEGTNPKKVEIKYKNSTNDLKKYESISTRYAQLAAICANEGRYAVEGFINYGFGSELIAKSNNILSGIISDNRNGSYDDCENYKKFIANNTANMLKKIIYQMKTEPSLNGNIYGPLKVAFANYEGYNTLDVNPTNCKVVDKNGNPCSITSKTNFYLKVTDTTKEFKVDIKNSYKTYGAVLLFFGKSNVNQNRCIYKPFYNYLSKKITIKDSSTEENYPLALKIKKRIDDTGSEGVEATFEVKFTQGTTKETYNLEMRTR